MNEFASLPKPYELLAVLFWDMVYVPVHCTGPLFALFFYSNVHTLTSAQYKMMLLTVKAQKHTKAGSSSLSLHNLKCQLLQSQEQVLAPL